MQSMYPDALTIQGSIGAPLDKDPECHHPTFKHLILGLNHLNGRTPIAPWLMYPHQHQDPECHHPTLIHIINHLNERTLTAPWLMYPLH